MSHIFETPNISSEKLSISIEMPVEYDCHLFLKYLVFQKKNLVFRSETLYFDRKTLYFKSKFEALGFLHIEFEISISKKV